jgi:oligoribonuclease (3'-5' exoribonuclease)
MPDNHLLWLDLETTGLDEHAGDQIIEIGCILTTEDLVAIGEFQTVVLPSQSALNRLMSNDVVREMHVANGLLNELDDFKDLPRVGEMETDLLAWLDTCGSPKKLTLAGSGVAQFDSRFVRALMPELAKRLGYYAIDVGVIRRAHAMWVGTDVSAANDSKTHRAIDDVRCHLDEARAYRALWLSTQSAVPG